MAPDWEEVWKELRAELTKLELSESPLLTLDEGSENNILKVEEARVLVQSRNPRDGVPKPRTITKATILKWWEHLHSHDFTSFTAKGPTRPTTANS